MSWTFERTYVCSECGYVFEGYSGVQFQGGGMFDFHRISPMVCRRCNILQNVVSGPDIDKDVKYCKICKLEMETMNEYNVYECPICHRKTLELVNTDSIYESGKICIY